MKKLKKKTKWSIITACTMIVAMSATVGTLAYLKDDTQVLANSFKVGSIETEIDEECDTYGEKNPSIHNVGENPALVRLRCLVSPEDMSDNIVLDFSTDKTGNWYDGLGNDSNIVSFMDNRDVRVTADTLDEDYYYYWGVIYPEDVENKEHSTTCFFDGYSVTDDSGNSIFVEDKNSSDYGKILEGKEFTPFEITIYQESVQAVVTMDNGDILSAINADGSFNAKNAKLIWEQYDSQK